MITILNRIIRNKAKRVAFPKISNTKFNYLWEVSKNTMISLSIIELIPILRSLIFKFGASSLLGIPIVFYIFKISGILDQKDTENHLKMFKALNVDQNNI